MSDPDVEIFRVGLDGRGGTQQPIDEAVARWTHYRLEESNPEWLTQHRRISETVADALVVGNARPRASRVEDGILVVMRGVNCNPGADPEDMVSMRAWLQADRIVTVSPRRVLAIEDVYNLLSEGSGPSSQGDVLTSIAERLVNRMRPIVDGLEETADDIHESLLSDGPRNLQRKLGQLRHTITILRRHMAPQRDALAQLCRMKTDQLSEANIADLQQIGDRQIRYVEDLDSLRERAGVLQDEINNSISNALNQNMYMLSVVAAIFLPLGLLTGLLGINVGGMPGVESPLAFWTVCAILVVCAIAEIWYLRRRRMF